MVLLKPQRSAPGAPFMKSITGSLLTSCSSRVLSGTSLLAVAARVTGTATGAAASAWLFRAIALAVMSGALTPITLPTTLPPWRKTKAGTELISYFSAMSSASSASTLANLTRVHSLASRVASCSVWVHIGAHEAHKCTTVGSSPLRVSASSSATLPTLAMVIFFFVGG